MVKIAGSKKLKRQMAPLFWGITRKNKRFVVTVKPGMHPKNASIPISVFLRDTIKIVTSLREAKSVIYSGKIKVDGKVTKISIADRGVNIEGVKKEKLKGEKFDVYVHTTNIVISGLNSEDKWRINKLEGKKASAPRPVETPKTVAKEQKVKTEKKDTKKVTKAKIKKGESEE